MSCQVLSFWVALLLGQQPTMHACTPVYRESAVATVALAISLRVCKKAAGRRPTGGSGLQPECFGCGAAKLAEGQLMELIGLSNPVFSYISASFAVKPERLDKIRQISKISPISVPILPALPKKARFFLSFWRPKRTKSASA